MLYMVVERIKQGCVDLVGERFRERGRMLPEGVIYIDSWMETSGDRCFQIMTAESPDILQEWIGHWRDLVDFEVTAVQTSAEFWASRTARPTQS